MARIVGHLPIEELEARYRAAREATEARHFQAICLLAQGRTVLEVSQGRTVLEVSEVLAFVPRWVEELAFVPRWVEELAFVPRWSEVLAFVPRWVEELARRYNAFGPEALGDRRRRNGRAASLLTEDVLAALAERVKAPPEDGGVWSGPEVAAWMARRLGLAEGHAQRGWEALKRIGWSIQAPRPRHARAATPEQRAAFKGGSRRQLRRPRRRIRTGRSRSGPRTSIASG